MPDFIAKNILSWVIFFPLLGAVILVLLSVVQRGTADEEEDHGHGHEGEDAPKYVPNPRAQTIRWFTAAWTFVAFLLSVGLLTKFQANGAGFQLQEGPIVWIKQFKVNYHVGIDGISLLLILLTTFLSFLCAVYSFSVKKRIREYMIFLLVLETAMTGVFCALDLVLFYVFWEAVLIPMYFLIGIWGHERRIYAAIKFFLYTFAGSVLMLVGIVYLYVHTHTFNLVELLTTGSEAHGWLTGMDGQMVRFMAWSLPVSGWLFLAFALAFMIKVPMFPFHTWLPDAHVEAPTAGSVILAGVMLKMGTYGFLRFCLPLFPVQAKLLSPWFIALAVFGIVYGAVVATMQPDMKKLVAYSSVSHLGFVMLGIFSFTQLGITGAVLQSINHGVSTGMLFFLVGMLYERRHTRLIAAFGGLKRAVPILSTFFLIAMLSSVALPLTNGFVGEFTILQGSFLSEFTGPRWTSVATTGMVLSAIYMLWLFQRVFTGPITQKENHHLRDLIPRERFVLGVLVVMVFWFGCYVSTWTKYLTTPVTALMGMTGSGEQTANVASDERRAAGDCERRVAISEAPSHD